MSTEWGNMERYYVGISQKESLLHCRLILTGQQNDAMLVCFKRSVIQNNMVIHYRQLRLFLVDYDFITGRPIL